MPNIGDPDGPDLYSPFTRGSEYHGGPGGGNVERHFQCGMHYKGGYKDDEEHGQGKLTTDSGSSYEGNWQDGKYHGEGTYQWPSGSSYKGQWVEGRKEGRGAFTLYNGNVYDGDWVNDQRHGWGVYTVAKPTCGGLSIYEGEWVKDLRTGRGTTLGADAPGSLGSATAATLEISRYDDGKRVGEGVRWLDGSKFKAPRPGDDPIFTGPWRLQDGREVEEIDDATADAIAKSLDLEVPTFAKFKRSS